MESEEDFDQARAEVIAVVARNLEECGAGANVVQIASGVVDQLLYDFPHLIYRISEQARRAWYWSTERSADQIWPLVFLGGDEFLNRTVGFRIPRAGTLIVALNVPLRRLPVPVSVEDPDEWLRAQGPASVFERYRVRDLAVSVVLSLRARARRVRRSV